MNLEAVHTDTDDEPVEDGGRKTKPSAIAERDARRHFRADIKEGERDELAAENPQKDDSNEKWGWGLNILEREREAKQPRTLPVPKSEGDIKAIFEASEAIRDELDELDLIRPKTRGECSGVPRPCPLVGCKYNNYLDVNRNTGTIRINNPGLTPDQIPPAYSCALDVADRHRDNKEMPAEIVGTILNLSRTRVFQIEEDSLPLFASLGRR